jgi:hypothetical protein
MREKTYQLTLTEEDCCLIMSALTRFSGSQIQWSRVAKSKGLDREATARMETAKRIDHLLQWLQSETKQPDSKTVKFDPQPRTIRS